MTGENQKLRDYQLKGRDDILSGWSSGHQNILYVLPTGGGKTRLFTNIAREFGGNVVIVAHRETIVSQISLSLANQGVRHHVIAPLKTIRDISATHAKHLNNSFVDSLARVTIGMVDTMVRRINKPDTKKWANKIDLWINDESHHVLKTNKWGKVLQSFTNARGLGVTATPTRTDGYGLSKKHDGLFDFKIEGPTMESLIDEGYLTPYKIYCPPSNFDASKVKVSSNGELNQLQLNAATLKSTIVGDVVVQYLKYAKGKRGLTFCPSIESGSMVVARFNIAGVKAKLITAKSKDRGLIIKELENGKISQIVSVDTLGEGVDVPSIEVCSFLRKTESLGLYLQQFGRGMRPAPGKEHIIILDHVGNVQKHNLPDIKRNWTMDRREKKGRSKLKDETEIPITICLECFQPFPARAGYCPHCGIEHHRGGSSIEEVGGDLTLLTRESINKMKFGINDKISEVQIELREKIAQWAGNKKYLGMSNSEIYKLFYSVIGIDILAAQLLNKKQATELIRKIHEN